MPSAHIFRVSWSGTQAGGPEIFVYDQHIAGTGAQTPSDVVTAIESHVGIFLDTAVVSSSIATDVRDLFPPDVHWSQVKVAEIDPTTNKYKTGVLPVVSSLDEDGGSAGFVGLCLPDTLAVTTRSASVGRRIYNRFYLPRFTAASTDGTGRLKAEVLPAIINGLKAQEADLEVKLDTTYHYCNFSPADHTDKAIQDYYVGDVLDTQRRRRNQLVEARTIVTF